MGWFTSLFTSLDSSQRVHKGRALSSTHDAFSLPTSSPGFGSHPDAFNPEALQTPDIDAQTPSYTYPPAQSKGQYGYLPSPLSATSRQGSASLLPTHVNMAQSPLSSSHPQYPPLAHTWNRLRVWLSREYPELGDTLNYGILPEDLAEVEMSLGLQLPSAVRESYQCVDGQEPESAAGCSEGLFFGLSLLPLENVLEEWRFWREVDEDSTTGANPKLLEVMQSIPPRWIRLEYSNRGWIPLIADKAGNYVGIDMNPGEEGSAGQVIIFGRDFDTKVVLWNGDGWGGWAKWLAAFADELESGEGFEIGHGDTSSDGSEDDVGYESYYHDGSGRGAGDGGGSGAQGGLRLIGEYRGWSVLEAWGDRSLRRWHEAGLLPEYSEEPAVPTENVGLGVTDIAHQNGAEVPVPVLTAEETSQEAASSSSAHAKTRSTAVPTISITKPPAPQPVDLPTQSDISVPDDLLSAGNEYDLETGRGHPRIQDLQEEIALVDSKRLSQREPFSPLLPGESESSASAIPLSPPPPMDPPTISTIIPVDEAPATISPAVTATIPDLMTEETPQIAAVPLAPSQSTSSTAEPIEPVPVAKPESSSEEEEESSEEEDDDDEEEEEEEEEGEKGGEEEEDEEDEDDDDDDDDEEEEEESSSEETKEEPPANAEANAEAVNDTAAPGHKKPQSGAAGTTTST